MAKATQVDAVSESHIPKGEVFLLRTSHHLRAANTKQGCRMQSQLPSYICFSAIQDDYLIERLLGVSLRKVEGSGAH